MAEKVAKRNTGKATMRKAGWGSANGGKNRGTNRTTNPQYGFNNLTLAPTVNQVRLVLTGAQPALEAMIGAVARKHAAEA